jgi:hypothetical protein
VLDDPVLTIGNYVPGTKGLLVDAASAVRARWRCKEDYDAFFSSSGSRADRLPRQITTLEFVDEESVAAKIAGACNAVRIVLRDMMIGDMFDEGFVCDSGATTPDEFRAIAQIHYVSRCRRERFACVASENRSRLRVQLERMLIMLWTSRSYPAQIRLTNDRP